jgi:enoyl-CoA hydratase/carnithine racemase
MIYESNKKVRPLLVPRRGGARAHCRRSSIARGRGPRRRRRSARGFGGAGAGVPTTRPGRIAPTSRDASCRVAARKVFEVFLDFPKPIVVAVNGPAIGATVTTSTLADAVVASAEHASFNTPFARLGVPPEVVLRAARSLRARPPTREADDASFRRPRAPRIASQTSFAPRARSNHTRGRCLRCGPFVSSSADRRRLVRQLPPAAGPKGCSSVHFPFLMGEATAERMLGAEGWVPSASEAAAAGLITKAMPHDALLPEARSARARRGRERASVHRVDDRARARACARASDVFRWRAKARGSFVSAICNHSPKRESVTRESLLASARRRQGDGRRRAEHGAPAPSLVLPTERWAHCRRRRLASLVRLSRRASERPHPPRHSSEHNRGDGAAGGRGRGHGRLGAAGRHAAHEASKLARELADAADAAGGYVKSHMGQRDTEMLKVRRDDDYRGIR